MATLTQGEQFTDTQGRTGIVNFDTQTGKQLTSGQTTQSPNISVGQIAPTSAMQITPQPVTDINSLNATINSSIASIPQLQANLDENTKSNQNTSGDIMSTLNELMGKSAFEQQQGEALGLNAETANLNKYQQDLNDITAQGSALARQAQAIPLQIQQNAANTGATDRGVAPMQAQQLRENAIKALTLGSQSDILTANINNSQIRYNMAKDKVKQAVDLKYQPMEQKLEALKLQLELNDKYFTQPAEKKLAQAQALQLEERSRLLTDKKEQDKLSSVSILNAIQGKAPQSIIDKAQEAVASGKSSTEVAKILGTYSMSASDKLDMVLKQEQIKTQQASRSKIFSDMKRESAADAKTRKEEEAIIAQNKINLPNIKDKITLIDSIKNSKGLNSRVGPNAFGRKFLAIGDSFGAGQDFAGSVKQLTSAETLNTLINLKKAGGTLGALSETELEILRNSATKINQWEKKKKGIGLGKWDIDQKSFNKELDNLRRLTEKAYTEAGGILEGSQGEQDALNNYFNQVDSSLQLNNYGNYDLN